MDYRKKSRKAIWWAIVIICTILLAAIAAVLILRSVGKRALESSVQVEEPVLLEENQKLDIDLLLADDGTVIYEGEKYKYNEYIWTFLFMGIDKRGKVSETSDGIDCTKGGQADTLFLVAINPHKEMVEVIAINRNSMTEVDVYDSEGQYIRTDLLQVCLQHGYGSGLEDSCERQVATVSRMFYNLPIHGYFAMNLDAIPVLNDYVGGVTLEVLENIPRGSEVIAHGEGNVVTLKGMDAYHYLQYRDINEFDSATKRLSRQKQYMNAIVHKMIAETKKDITFPLKVLSQLEDYVVTDITSSKFTYLASTYLTYDFDSDNVYSLPGTTNIGGGGFEEYTVDEDYLYDTIIRVFYEKVED